MATLIATSRGVSSAGLLIKTCYCNRDFTVAEVTDIITQLRKKDNVHDEQQYSGKDPIYITVAAVQAVKLGKEYYALDRKTKITDTKGIKKYELSKCKFDELGITIFQSTELEKIPSEYANLNNLTKQLNLTLNKYSINTCIRKIHFLAQTYHESERFVNTYEGLVKVPDNYKGGFDFQGRGLKQITHDMNYLEYYDKINGMTYFKDNYQGKNNKAEGLTQYIARVKKNGFPEGFLETLKVFTKKLSTELSYACDSSGWFWDTREINNEADQDNVTNVTKLINGGDNCLKERKKYTSDLKIIFDYEKCINKK